MRIISWAVIFGSAVALFFSAVRPLAQQLGLPSGDLWQSAEIDRRQSLGAMLAPEQGERRACADRTTAAGSFADSSAAPASPRASDRRLCVESAVARH